MNAAHFGTFARIRGAVGSGSMSTLGVKAMSDSVISNSDRSNSAALRFAEIARQNPALRAMFEANPESLPVFVRSLLIASRISSGRAELLEAVTRAADASDSVLEAMNGGVGFDLVGRLVTAGQALDHLGKMLADVDPTTGSALRIVN